LTLTHPAPPAASGAGGHPGPGGVLRRSFRLRRRSRSHRRRSRGALRHDWPGNVTRACAAWVERRASARLPTKRIERQPLPGYSIPRPLAARDSHPIGVRGGAARASDSAAAFLAGSPDRVVGPPAGDQRGAGSRNQAELERRRAGLIATALERGAEIQKDAAKLLGVSRRTLINRLEQFGIARPRKRRDSGTSV